MTSTPLDVIEGRARWCLVEGDCLDRLASLPAKSVHHVITDPPYSEHVHSKSRAGARKTPLADGNGNESSRCAIDRAVDFGFAHITTEQMDKVADQCERLATRWSLAFCDVESSHLWSGAFRSAGLDYCRTMIWEKEGATPQFTGDRPGVAVETMVTAHPTVGFDCMSLAHPSGRKRWHGGGKLGIYRVPIERAQYAQADDRISPTQKPIDLMLRLTEDFTDPDDIVLDPFAGGATTGVACLRLGRRFIGMELRPEQVVTARQRLEAEAAGIKLSAARSGQIALFGGAA